MVASPPSSPSKVRLHLGTMTFAWKQSSKPIDDNTALAFLDKFVAAGGRTVDCARVYAGGESEKMLGRSLAARGNRDSIELVTKANPAEPDGLSPLGLKAQAAASLEALQVSKVDILYLHQPDTVHSLASTLECVNELVTGGTVGAFGLSNYSAAETERVLQICREKGYVLPIAYQGLYNAINRRVEVELFPLLRANGLTFVAYNGLAAGMLTGKHTKDAEVPQGRFKDNKNYLDRYFKADHFEALDGLKVVCDKHGIPVPQAAYSWLLCHSGLADGDGLLLGASSIEQLDQNLAFAAGAAALPAEVIAALDASWELCRPEAFAFWRGYSLDHPGREGLDQGGAYSVSKI
eukprot:gnl/TRDRNA2_/TRDRNA2_92071_c0_seq1.p1 gnl/TRDRNA2_/TRDRNA2_92071_c0~~gnl/TRDRNA2_/TRDRNA2_92071_c0_seq1.p1  ORF type:complete len:350 (-),score=55.33 gnl/TRDRNA2_/TRDRNA2_92071_c0_seq1:194-1243(-)